MTGSYIHFNRPRSSGIHIFELHGVMIASLHTDFTNKDTKREAIEEAKATLKARGFNPIIHESLL